MPVEFDRGSPGKLDSRTLNRKTLNRWTGRNNMSGHLGFETLNLNICEVRSWKVTAEEPGLHHARHLRCHHTMDLSEVVYSI